MSGDLRSVKAESVLAKAVVIETDQYLGKNNGDLWTRELFEEAWRQSLKDLEIALRRPGVAKLVLVVGIPAAGKSTAMAGAEAGAVYLDEAYLVEKDRRSAAMAIAKKLGLPTEVLWVDTPLEVCIQRNEKRASNRRVPLEVQTYVHETLKQKPPTKGEGLSRIVKRSGQGLIAPSMNAPVVNPHHGDSISVFSGASPMQGAM